MFPLHPSPAFAFFFASPWMLLWGLAAAAPIVLHFWSRRRRREATWAAMEFLVAAVRKNARRLRLEQLVLLAVRTAVLLVFAAALADPLLERLQGDAPAAEQRPNHWVLVIDSSYSMDYRQSGRSAFDLAREEASQIVREGRPGDGYSLVLMADPPEEIIGPPAHDRDNVIEEIDALELRHTGANLIATLTIVRKVVDQANEEYSSESAATTKIVIYSDLCENTWRATETKACREVLAELAKTSDIELVDVGEPAAENTAVVEIAADQSLAVVERPLGISATLRTFGGGAPVERQIEFFVDGRRQQVSTAHVPAGGQQAVRFTHRFATAGDHTVEAVLSHDNLPLDDRRYLSVSIRSAVSVLCIEGQPGAARFISLALAPDESSRSGVQVTIVSEEAIRQTELADYDCLFLCNVGRLGKDEAAQLHRYVARGGAVAIVLGDRVQRASYNAELGAGSDSLLPALLEAPSPLGEYAIDPLGYRHPLAAPFRGHDRAGLLSTPVWKYTRLAPIERDSARIALAFKNGDPAIIEERIGRGRSILIATDLSDLSVDGSTTPPTPWTAWPAWPSFPPIVNEILKLGLAGDNDDRNRIVGQPIDDEAPATAREMSVLTPDGATIRAAVSHSAAGASWRLRETWRRGIYEARVGDEPPQLFAVNLDADESSLARFDEELLPSQLLRDESGDAASTPVPEQQARPVFRYLLGAVLALLMLESTLGWAMGRWTG